ncbi:hypothetical protein N800_11525 [Lysobacter daejeonensis GH1-9]|uniref:Uncharacterized protein n=1 Tax=Lysobacter daejeonensis GH1-9 TaxID=1385517 RepID=A0A0A0EXR3_9GAMM|nr:hypothetical protein N800_11525 [Lysobacter daejeonensis GH1-9]
MRPNLTTPLHRALGTPANAGVPLPRLDHFAGTYIDHCAKGASASTVTEAEMREQQRGADEAIKVIEATTPEVR